MKEKTKAELYADWIKAKKAENKARDKRTEIEAQIEATLPKFDEKSKTLHEDGFKITVKRSENCFHLCCFKIWKNRICC